MRAEEHPAKRWGIAQTIEQHWRSERNLARLAVRTAKTDVQMQEVQRKRVSRTNVFFFNRRGIAADDRSNTGAVSETGQDWHLVAVAV